MKIILTILVSCMLVSCKKDDRANMHLLIPSIGSSDVKIGDSVVGPPFGALIPIPNREGKVKAVYTTDKNYALSVGDAFVCVGDSYDSLPKNVKDILKMDRTTMDIIEGDWYVSDKGFFLVVKSNVVVGIAATEISK